MFVEVIKYSDKYLAVFGDTGKIQDALIEMGARRNPRLIYKNTTKPGWRIPLEREAELYAIIDMAGLNHTADDLTVKNFPAAVRSYVSHYGKNALMSSDSVNVLSDMNAFDELPSLKNVYRILLMDGFIEQMIDTEKWNRDCDALSFKIKNDYAISNIIVEYIFKSIAYANGIYEEVKPIKSKEYQSLIPKPYVNPDIPWEYRTPEERAEYLESLIEIDEESFMRYRLAVRQISIEPINNKDSAYFNYEIIPIGSIKEAFLSLYFSCYNDMGKLLKTNQDFISLNYRKKRYIGKVWIYGILLSKIKKILIHID